MAEHPGLVVLLGSGEIAPSGRKVHDWVMRQLRPPIRVAILEIPAGFQPNSELVAGKMAEFVSRRLQNYDPRVTVIAARKRGTPSSFHMRFISRGTPGIATMTRQYVEAMRRPGGSAKAVLLEHSYEF